MFSKTVFLNQKLYRYFWKYQKKNRLFEICYIARRGCFKTLLRYLDLNVFNTESFRKDTGLFVKLGKPIAIVYFLLPGHSGLAKDAMFDNRKRGW